MLSGEEGGWRKGRDAGAGGRRAAERGDDDSAVHCGGRRIQGSKSDYQLVSEARLRCSLTFRATFYFRWLDNDPALQAHAAPEGLATLPQKPPHILKQHSKEADDSTVTQLRKKIMRRVKTLEVKWMENCTNIRNNIAGVT